MPVLVPLPLVLHVLMKCMALVVIVDAMITISKRDVPAVPSIPADRQNIYRKFRLSLVIVSGYALLYSQLFPWDITP